MARRPLIAGNWKMNAGGRDAMPLAINVAKAAKDLDRADVLLCPPFTAIAAVSSQLEEDKSRVMVGAQNMHAEPSGAFTGEIASSMLLDAGASWVILGHSERRQLFGETDEGVARKTAAAMAAGLRPVVCVGETLEQREAGSTLEVVERQVRAFLDELAKQPGYGAVAYEPVWAIGTGRTCDADDAQEVCAAVRHRLAETHGDAVAARVRVLYGGSVKPSNVAGIMARPDIDGALVGGASLKAEDFAGIVRYREHPAA
jgi:triosephosphate isomerase